MDDSPNLQRDPPLSDFERRWLRELGIDVWLARPAAMPVATQVAAQVASRNTPTPIATPVVVPVAGKDSAPAAGAALARVAATSTPTPPPANRTAELDVLCITMADVVLIGAADDLRQHSRFARDLVRGCVYGRDKASATPVAERRKTLQEHSFFWPQPGVSGDLRPAFSAFVDKRLADSGARLLLLAEALVNLVDGDRIDAEVLPLAPLAQLAAGGERKRELWHWILQQTA